MTNKIILIGKLEGNKAAVIVDRPDFPIWESFWADWVHQLGGVLTSKLELGGQKLDKQLLRLEKEGYEIIYTNL